MSCRGSRSVARAWLAGAAILAALGSGATGAEDVVPEPARTEALVSAYGRAEGWPVKALVLLSLGDRWHPAGAPVLVDALHGGDPRLQAYATEALRDTAPEHLRRVLVPSLVEEIVSTGLAIRNSRVHLSLLLLLARAFPEAGARSPQEWAAWWRTAKTTHAVAPWTDSGTPPVAGESITVETPVVRRAFDLSQGGIQLVLAIDTTGSMQPTIDAVRAGMADAIRILSGIAPDLEVGVVQYRDREDLPNRERAEEGAALVERLTRRIPEVQRGLDRLQALGGGDRPERVEAGLRVALDPAVGWERRANKMVIVVGDAPPQDEAEAVTLARWAGRASGGRVGGGGRPGAETPGGARGPERSFTVSAVGVGPFGALPDTAASFRRIAEAGGGVYVSFATGGPPRAAGAEIVRRLVELSFGAKHAAAARRLVDVYLVYRDAGFLTD